MLYILILIFIKSECSVVLIWISKYSKSSDITSRILEKWWIIRDIIKNGEF